MKWFRGGLVAVVVAGLGVWAWLAYAEAVRSDNERSAAEALKTLASGEADFRGNDRDGNLIQDFWAGDVAGLYYFQDVKLIEKDVADADAKPIRPGAPPPVTRRGYFFVAMMGTDSYPGPEDYAQDTHGEPNRGPFFNHSRFAFCAYPADYPRSGRWTFCVNEGNTIFKIDTGGKPVLRWPPPIPGICRRCEDRDSPSHVCVRGDHP